MIHVCHIITKLELGGAQQNTLYTVSHLDNKAFRPILIAGTEGLLVEEAERYHHVRQHYTPHLVREIRPHRDVRAFFHLARLLKYEQQQHPHEPFLVHTHSSKAGVLGRWAARYAGASGIIHSIHGFGFHADQAAWQRWLFILLERMTAPITSRFIAVSKANILTGKQLNFFSDSQVSLIRSGIDIQCFQSQADLIASDAAQRIRRLQQTGLPLDVPLVGMIACFKPQKAPCDFVHVMKRVREKIPNAHGVMIGDGVLRPAIEAAIAEQNMQDGISLLGWRTDVPELLPLFRVLVLTSRWEGLPRVCPQAMAAGIPVAATNVDGIPEAVLDGKTGFLNEPGDLEGLSRHIITLLQDPELAQKMGREGRKRVEEFDIQRMVRQQEELYRSLAADRNA